MLDMLSATCIRVLSFLDHTGHYPHRSITSRASRTFVLIRCILLIHQLPDILGHCQEIMDPT